MSYLCTVVATRTSPHPATVFYSEITHARVELLDAGLLFSAGPRTGTRSPSGLELVLSQHPGMWMSPPQDPGFVHQPAAASAVSVDGGGSRGLMDSGGVSGKERGLCPGRAQYGCSSKPTKFKQARRRRTCAGATATARGIMVIAATTGTAAASARTDGRAARSIADAGHRQAHAAGRGAGSGKGSAARLGVAPATATVRAFAAARVTTRGPVIQRG